MQCMEKPRKRPFVVSVEIRPAVDDKLHGFLKDLNCIKGRVDCLNLPAFKKPSPIIDSLHTGRLLIEKEFQTFYQATTRRKHRPTLEADLCKAHQLEVVNFLVFLENDTRSDTSAQEKTLIHQDAAKLHPQTHYASCRHC